MEINEIEILSVGVDVGSSTSHLVFSNLLLKRDQRSVTRRFNIEQRNIIYEGKIIHTPGHSPGSCSIILDNGEALIGDLVRENSFGRIDTGLFYDNRDQIFDSLVMVSSLNPSTIFLSHGGMIRDVTRLNPKTINLSK